MKFYFTDDKKLLLEIEIYEDAHGATQINVSSIEKRKILEPKQKYPLKRITELEANYCV